MQYRNGSTMRAAAVLALLVLGACSHVFERPEVRLESVGVRGIGLRGATLVAQLHVDNPNSFDLKTRSLTYNLELQDPQHTDTYMPLTQGTIDERIEVRGNSAKIIEIPFEFNYSDLGPAVKALLDRGTFNYRVSGRLEVQEPMSRSVPFRKTGQVSMSGVK